VNRLPNVINLKKRRIANVTRNDTHRPGNKRRNLFTKYNFKFFLLSNDEKIRNPLITKKIGTPGKYTSILLTIKSTTRLCP
jgi:hypothetical protein